MMNFIHRKRPSSNRSRTFWFLLLATSLQAGALAERLDWPQWRGPDRTDTSSESGLLKSWPEGGPKRLWLFEECGNGYSGPAIVGDQLFTMGGRDKKEFVICVDVENGKERWATEIDATLKNGWGDGPRSTPTVNGEHVYAFSGNGTLACLKIEDGKEVWRKKMSDLGGSVPGWGYTESVLVDGDKVICTPGGQQGAVVALNKENGETIWQSVDFRAGAHYSSSILVDHNSARQLIQLFEKNLVGFDVVNGNVLWKADWTGSVAVVSTPIFSEGHVYVTSGYGAGCNLFHIGEGNEVKEIYDSKAKKLMKNHHGGVVLYEGHVFGYSDGNGWVCQNFKSGEQAWREREKFGKGAIGFADGKFYLVAENSGEVVLIDATADGWRENGRFTLDPQSKIRHSQGKIWVHPVIVGGKLFLRDQDLLYCFDVKAE